MKNKINLKYNLFFSLSEKARHKVKSNNNYYYLYPTNSFIIERGLQDWLYYLYEIENNFKHADQLSADQIKALANRIVNFFDKYPRHKSVVITFRN